MRVVVIGRGRLGHGLARSLDASDLDVVLTRGRRTRKSAPVHVARGDVVLLAVPDAAIAEAAEALARQSLGGVVVLHAAGARTARDLDACARVGAATGVMHPLVSFPTPRAAPELRDTSFVIAGAPGAVRAAKRIARAVGARPLVADVHGARYHAAAALVANGAAALAATSVKVLERLGVTQRDAERAVGALLRTVAANVERIGVPDALTGPVARGDAATVAAHRRALSKDRSARAAYDAIAPTILGVAREAGLDDAHTRAIRRVLET